LVVESAGDARADTAVQLESDATGQPIGSAEPSTYAYVHGTQVRGLVQERTATWPMGPGADAELVDTHIFLPFGTLAKELDTIWRIDLDPPKAYQVVFANPDPAGQGRTLQ